MPKNQPELKLISLEDIVVEPVRWLWYPYIPLGKLSIIHGDPAEGKTTLALWIAAACSRGLALPGGETGEPLTVLYQTAEDGLGDTIKPRLLESKADLQKLELAPLVRERLLPIFSLATKQPDFGNGRFARNLLEKSRMKQASRLVRLDPDTVTMEMVSTLIPEDIDEPQLPQKEERRVLGFCA